MDIGKLREDFDFLDSQNVETLTNNVKTVCPVLDNGDHVDSSVTESASDHHKDSEDLSQSHENTNENSFDKIARRPVETWKYLPFKTDYNRMSYKCSLCCSVYQHKKSLNKHWKDKHFANLTSSGSSTPFQERVSSNIPINPQPIFPTDNVIMYPSDSNIQDMLPIKRDIYNPQILVGDSYPPTNRKRLSLQITECDENKENYPINQPKRMSLLPMQSLMFRQGRSICDSINVVPSLDPYTSGSSEKIHSLMVRSNRNISNSIKEDVPLTSPGKGSSRKMIERPQPEMGALDLRISKLFNGSSLLINFRCFQCVFHTNSIVELNEHFKHLHVSILLGVKSFCLPMTVYQKLLLNQFTAIVRTESEPLDLFNGPMSCFLCNFKLPTRYDMIQHVGIIHETEMVWVCLVCGFGCRFPVQLSHHFRSHSDIQMWAKSVAHVEAPAVIIKANYKIDTTSPKPENHLATSTPNNKPKRIPSRKDQSSSDQCSVKEKPLKCLVCDATARWRSELFTHMITHSEHRSFGCQFCSYRSKWKWDVPKHLKRCRMAPPNVRKPDVQNSYLITLLHHYSPPPGDILYEFMKQYNIKDLGTLNRPLDIKMEEEENIQNEEQLSSKMNSEKKFNPDIQEQNNDKGTVKSNKYEMISDVSEEDADLDVGVDHIFEESMNRSEPSLKYSFKRCPWCQNFLTNKPSEMSCHLADHHSDIVPSKG